MAFKTLFYFTRQESSSGIFLIGATIAALIVANSPLILFYQALFEQQLGISIGNLSLEKTLLLWINDGLMAIFFLIIGIELKKELLFGHLSKLSKASLPLIAALGGIFVPGLFYLFFNFEDPIARQGWAIPVATDIAFAVGTLSLLGTRVPRALKIFLLSLAIFDDLAAILIIGVFYTASLSFISMLCALILIITLIILNKMGIRKLMPYMIIGLVFWICVLKSGVHATLAGVILAFIIPIKRRLKTKNSPGELLKNTLNPWVDYGILPLFAFANAGISFADLTLSSLSKPIPLGIICGLLFGKTIGIFCFTAVAKLLKIAHLPKGVNLKHIFGLSILCGIGFTMSLFIGGLAFGSLSYEYVVANRVGILVGSFFAGVFGMLTLYIVLPSKKA